MAAINWMDIRERYPEAYQKFLCIRTSAGEKVEHRLYDDQMLFYSKLQGYRPVPEQEQIDMLLDILGELLPSSR